MKLMTWNVENLYRAGHKYGPTSDAAYSAKLSGLAATINEQAPDVLALQEIGEPEALDDLMALLDGGFHRELSAHHDGRGIRVAWLTRSAVESSEDIIDFPRHLKPIQGDDDGATVAQMGRGALAVTVGTQAGGNVRLVTAHLKSKLLTYPGERFAPRDEDERARFGAYALYRRAAEATTLRVWASGALAGAGAAGAVILAGDLNDTVQAATTQLLLGPPGSEIGTPGFDRPDRGDNERLWNLAPLMPEGRNYSRVTEGRKELIDHVLVSAALVRRVAAVEVLVDHEIPSVGPDPRARRDTPSSDHAPIVVTFKP